MEVAKSFSSEVFRSVESMFRNEVTVSDNENQPYGVYILRCADNSYYTGLTNNLKRRVATHNAGRGARYTRTRLPVEPIFWWDNLNKRDAYRVEWLIKQLSRPQKQRLIDGDEQMLNRLKRQLTARETQEM